ncbi:MAG: glycosyltransferase [Bacteroidia bacterium]|nr:glycosyltransferase [Bacteroidia bacterium]
MKTKNILVLTYWDINDALIQTYTLPYVKIMAQYIPDNSKIYVLTLNKKKSFISEEHPKIKWITFRYIPFGMKAIFYYLWMLLYLYMLIYRKRIHHIHAWCTPAGAFGYVLSLLTGRPLVIDSYEPHAESMVEVGEWKKNSLAFHLLFWLEKKMTHHAQYLIATTERAVTEYAVSRYQFEPQKNNWFVKPACVDLEVFQPNIELRKKMRSGLNIENKIVGIYVGKFGGIYLEDDFFQWLKTAQEYWKEKFAFILLSSHTEAYMTTMCQKYNIDTNYIIHRFVPHKEVINYLNAADFGITPVKSVYTKQFCSPIKDGEYWAMGLPVIITNNISDDSKIVAENGIGYVLQTLNKKEFFNSIVFLDELIHKKHKQTTIIKIAQKYRNLNNVTTIYQNIYSE